MDEAQTHDQRRDYCYSHERPLGHLAVFRRLCSAWQNPNNLHFELDRKCEEVLSACKRALVFQYYE